MVSITEGYLLKRNATQGSTRFFFQINGHYLLYFKSIPSGSSRPAPEGAWDLWKVRDSAARCRGSALPPSPSALRLAASAPPHTRAAHCTILRPF